jgi:hypothetical protein
MTAPQPTDPAEAMRDAQKAYVDFNRGQQLNDNNNLKAKIEAFKAMQGDPEYLLMYFFTQILNAGDNQGGEMSGNGSSFARREEDKLQEVAKELNYASAFREAISQIKEQLELGKDVVSGGSPYIVLFDLNAMEEYRTKNWNGAPEIFQGEDDTFEKAIGDIRSVADAVNAGYYHNFNDLWGASQNVGDTKASALIQKFTNASDTLFSAVGVQNNVLNTQMQDVEANYKSYLSIDTQGWKALMSVISNAIKNSSSGG